MVTRERINQPMRRRSGKQETSNTSQSPNEGHLDLETSGPGLLVDQVGDGVTDTKVPQPVGGDGEGRGLGTDVVWEDLAGDHPSDRNPRGDKERAVDPHESDQNPLFSSVRGRDRDADDGDQELANTHPGGTDQEQLPTTKPPHTPHPRESREHVYGVRGDGDQEEVTDARILEEHGTV